MTDDRFKMNENDNAAAKSLEAIEKVFNEISKKTAADVTTDDMKQIVRALQNFGGTTNDKNVLVIDGTNILDVANILGKKVAAKEKYNAEQSQQQQQGQHEAPARLKAAPHPAKVTQTAVKRFTVSLE